MRCPAIGAAVLARTHEIAATAVRSMQLGEGDAGGDTEVVVQLWSRPTDQLIEQLIARLDGEFGDDVRSVSLRS